ncbi:MAG: hypothetical protein IJ769_08335 [Clostridia bacterium]|nr:hypothetical protein [Clostridia bacterium]
MRCRCRRGRGIRTNWRFICRSCDSSIVNGSTASMSIS